ncbi:General transcription factor IIE subunit 2 [Chlorella vulgaris]
MSRVNALLASFKQGQKKALVLQSEARQEREDKLAKAAAGAAAGRGRGAKAGAGRGRGGKTSSAASGDVSASVASAAGLTDWKQRSRSGQQAVPIGVKLKAIVDFLRAAGDPQKPAAIFAATGFDPEVDAKLLEALGRNNKVIVQDDGLFGYRPEVANVRSKQEVLDYLLRRERQGEGYAALGELQDAYPGVVSDLEALKKEGLILSLPAAETTRKEVFYPVDQRIHMKVDADLQELWQSVGDTLPDEDDELQEELRRVGLKPAPRQVIEKREAREKKKKARKVRRLTKVTNQHLKHLLEGDAPTNIENA